MKLRILLITSLLLSFLFFNKSNLSSNEIATNSSITFNNDILSHSKLNIESVNFSFPRQNSNIKKDVNPSSYVLICKSKSAYAYHSHYCSGLKRCTHTVVKVSKSDAINAGYKACKICY